MRTLVALARLTSQTLAVAREGHVFRDTIIPFYVLVAFRGQYAVGRPFAHESRRRCGSRHRSLARPARATLMTPFPCALHKARRRPHAGPFSWNRPATRHVFLRAHDVKGAYLLAMQKARVRFPLGAFNELPAARSEKRRRLRPRAAESGLVVRQRRREAAASLRRVGAAPLALP